MRLSLFRTLSMTVAGTIGMNVVANAKPDGYTFAYTPNGPITVQPHVIATLPYKFDSFQPICQVFAVQYVLVIVIPAQARTQRRQPTVIPRAGEDPVSYAERRRVPACAGTTGLPCPSAGVPRAWRAMRRGASSTIVG